MDPLGRRSDRQARPRDLHAAHRRLDFDARRTVFIDDAANDVATADQLGFATINFNEASTDLRSELCRLGLPQIR
jgi:beta-phosphoglucomutase-like phosphatase (HAD superfamily)